MKKLIKVKDVAKLTGYHEETIRQFVRAGKLKAYRRPTKGKRTALRFRFLDIENFMQIKKSRIEKRR